jgi:hypothetical protein
MFVWKTKSGSKVVALYYNCVWLAVSMYIHLCVCVCEEKHADGLNSRCLCVCEQKRAASLTLSSWYVYVCIHMCLYVMCLHAAL